MCASQCADSHENEVHGFLVIQPVVYWISNERAWTIQTVKSKHEGVNFIPAPGANKKKYS